MGLSVFSLQAQDAFQHKKVRVGIQVSPFYSYRTLKGPSELNYLIRNANEIDEAQIGFGVGLSFVIQLKKRLAFETGLSFSNRGYASNVEADSLGRNAFASVEIKHNYQYIGIPLKLNLYLLNRKTRLFISGGLYSNVFFTEIRRTSVETFDGDSNSRRVKITPSEPYYLLSTTVGVGLDFHIVKRLNLRFEPIFRYAIYNSKKVPVDYLPYDIGFNAGLYLGFK